MTALALLSLALASPGLDALSAGDLARCGGDRGEAVRLYREAAESGEPAAETMARLRLTTMRGNWGPAVHGGRLERAVWEAEGPWAAIAWADYHLFSPPIISAGPEEARRVAESALLFLPGPAAARIYLATGDPVWLERLAQAEERDGLGECLLATDGALWEDPGTWFLGLGVAGAPGAGVGGGLVFTHPDLAWRRWTLTAQLAATTRGTFLVGGSFRSPGRLYAHGDALVARTVWDLYDDEGQAYAFSQRALQASLGPGWSWQSWSLSGAARARWDDVGDGLLAAHGPQAALAWDHAEGWGGARQGLYGAVSGSWAVPALSDYESLRVFLDGRGYVGALKGVSALRLTWAGQLADVDPAKLYFALPAAGGAELHRGAWAGRYRAPWIATVDLEQRWMLIGPLEGVLFVNAAWVAEDGPHPAGGLGVRLLLPPEAFNVVRVDVAVSDSGWGVYTGFGETF
ncbi:MAG: hypothetical protein H6741_26445 [Alphaproteobacteria bacterium]|nr:hypothetical protein [Alphaproteobacteria bacterium]MCB9796249.1 hypothetical protein [Alphaproteobacteria bacterium]